MLNQCFWIHPVGVETWKEKFSTKFFFQTFQWSRNNDEFVEFLNLTGSELVNLQLHAISSTLKWVVSTQINSFIGSNIHFNRIISKSYKHVIKPQRAFYFFFSRRKIQYLNWIESNCSLPYQSSARTRHTIRHSLESTLTPIESTWIEPKITSSTTLSFFQQSSFSTLAGLAFNPAEIHPAVQTSTLLTHRNFQTRFIPINRSIRRIFRLQHV